MDATGSTPTATVPNVRPAPAGLPAAAPATRLRLRSALAGRKISRLAGPAMAIGAERAGRAGKCRPGGGHTRNVPQLLTIDTSPSASMRLSAETTVLRATPYSLASCATDGSLSCGCHSPALTRGRNAASTRRLGSSGVRSDGIQP
jgi:hypothetical protein